MIELTCLSCGAFKALELYPSFYYNKEDISSEELYILNKRRQNERKSVTKKDQDYPSNEIQEWFIINSEWLKDWKMFVNNKRSTTAYGTRRSVNAEVGILDPGPITNHLLLDSEGKPLPNLSKGKHYRGVNRAVWQQLYDTYGGGPVLIRRELSIYAEDIKPAEIKPEPLLELPMMPG